MSDDVFETLVDRNEIAHLLGVGPTAVSNYVARTNPKHAPFPEALITRSMGRFRLWDLDEVLNWFADTFPSRYAELDKDWLVRLQTFRGRS